MRQSIVQFMWAFQPHFRNGLERAARDVFEQIGFGLGARAYLIGFADAEDLAFPVCFEPETDALTGVDLSGVQERSAVLYEENPESQFFITSPRHHEARHRGLKDAMRAQALKEALESDPLGAEQYFFVGASSQVDGKYTVHPVIGVPRSRWDSQPVLSKTVIDRYPVVQSLHHAVMRELLRHATRDLSARVAPEDMSLRWADRSELIRTSAREFVQSVSVYAGHEFQSELVVALNEVAAQPYEGRSSSGGLLLTRNTDAVDINLEFVMPIRLSETRSVRKTLEMSGTGRHLLCNGESISGLGKLAASYDPATESAFVFTVVARGTWEMSHAGVPLLRVADTRPSLPRARLDGDRFKDTAVRVFGEASPTQVDRLWSTTLAAAEASHGTMLVVHRNAPDEAARLVPQAQQVQPRHLDAETLSAVTNIDGAVLVDVDGQCHAVGVILDGHATGFGEASRGARYNSAVRYHEAERIDSMVIIVSEDGMINLLPDLRRRVGRASVERVVCQVEAAAAGDPDYEVFFRHWNHLEVLAFYLNAQQCERANAARERLEDHRWSNSTMQIGWAPLTPDPEMDNSYLID